MARPNSIGRLAETVLAEVERERLSKTAELTYTTDDAVRTPVGQMLLKVAEYVHAEATGEISYADLEEFRERYGV